MTIEAGDNAGDAFLQVRNWDRFQNADVFKKSGGRPPWIKLYASVLDDPELDQLSPAELGGLVRCWLWAARLGNKLPASNTWARRRLGRDGVRIMSRLRSIGVIETYKPRPEPATKPPANHDKPSRTNREPLANDSRLEVDRDKKDFDLDLNLEANPPRANGATNGRYQRLETYVTTVAWQYEPPSLLEDLLAKGATPDEAEELLELGTAIAQRKQGENARAS